jgi:hypothetical protein
MQATLKISEGASVKHIPFSIVKSQAVTSNLKPCITQQLWVMKELCLHFSNKLKKYV